MKQKLSYRIKNWSIYNRSLINRGNLTLWFSDDVVQSWYSTLQTKKRGRRFTYSDACIEVALTLRSLFQFPLRSTQGFLEGLVTMLGINLKVPHYSRLSRRAADLQIDLTKKIKKAEKLDLVIDSTGLKIYGEGEWKMRTHGKQKRRTWRKYHVAVNPKDHQVIEIILTEANVHDATVLPDLLKNIDSIGTLYGDGAYTFKSGFDAIAAKNGKAKVPLRTGTSLVKNKLSPGQALRNEIVKEIRKSGGKTRWKKTSGYHLRSLVETHMFRLKTILGNKLNSRLMNNQKTEARIRSKILNQMSSLGMPISVSKAA